MLQQISVFLENRSGSLNELTRTLAEHNIDLMALFIAETSDYGIARIIVDDTATASSVLKKAGDLFSVDSVVAAYVPDRPGALNAILDIIADAGVNIRYMYSSFGKRDGRCVMIFRVDEPAYLAQVLSDKGIALMD